MTTRYLHRLLEFPRRVARLLFALLSLLAAVDFLAVLVEVESLVVHLLLDVPPLVEGDLVAQGRVSPARPDSHS